MDVKVLLFMVFELFRPVVNTIWWACTTTWGSCSSNWHSLSSFFSFLDYPRTVVIMRRFTMAFLLCLSVFSADKKLFQMEKICERPELSTFETFWYFLTWRSLSTFLISFDQGVLVKTEKRGMQGLELHAVTICPRFSSSRQAKIVFSYFSLKQSL